EIFDVGAVEGDAAVHEIVELHRAIRHAEANRARQRAAFARGDVAGAQLAAGAVVAPRAAGALGRFALGLEIFGGAVAVVRVAAREEPVEERRAGAADVQVTRWRGSEADARG